MKTTFIGSTYQVQAALGCLVLGFTTLAGAVIPSTSRLAPDVTITVSVPIELPDQSAKETQPVAKTPESDADEPHSTPRTVTIEAAESESDGKWEHKEVAWLGVSTEEASESLASQVGLRPGEGLLVLFVATNSPAAAAGIKKNDLIFEFEKQRLVLPTQLRKLVQMRTEGEKVELTLYRSGQKQNVSATLGKTKATVGMNMGGANPEAELAALHMQMQSMASSESVREMVRKAVEDSIRQATNSYHNYGSNTKVLAELARKGVEVDKDATVTIKSRDNSTRTVVKTDETGTYVIVANPQKRLLAHDKAGKLLFDGEIETPDQQSQVPAQVWTRVKPMLEQVKPAKSDTAPGQVLPKKTSTRPCDSFLFRSSQRIADLRTLVAMIRFVLEPDPLPTAMARTNTIMSRISAT